VVASLSASLRHDNAESEVMLGRCMYAGMSPSASLRHDDESGVIPRGIKE
jgi:hypothetical protein